MVAEGVMMTLSITVLLLTLMVLDMAAVVLGHKGSLPINVQVTEMDEVMDVL